MGTPWGGTLGASNLLARARTGGLTLRLGVGTGGTARDSAELEDPCDLVLIFT